MGGMSAFIPSRKDQEINEKAFKQVADDKKREAGDGFDGTWVAHPDSVPVAMEQFDAVLGDRPNQIDKQRPDVDVTARGAAGRLLGGQATHRGRPARERQHRHPVHLVLAARQRRGRDLQPHGGRRDGGDLALAGVAVDAPRRDADDTGEPITAELVRRLEDEELEKIRELIGDDEWFEREGRPKLSRELFERVALADEFLSSSRSPRTRSSTD